MVEWQAGCQLAAHRQESTNVRTENYGLVGVVDCGRGRYVKRNYATELAALPKTYATVPQSIDVGAARSALTYGGPLVFAGSGGALAVAQFAADLHTAMTGELAFAASPLALASAAHNADVGLVLFSARGRHPDGALVVEAARTRGAAHIGLITTRLRDELPPVLSAGDVRIATIPSEPDGFLATNSLLAMAVAVCCAHGVKLPASLPAFTRPWANPAREACMVLTGRGTGSIAVDLEARFTETGLAGVQMADYRNVAHGRHVGLVRNMDRTTVIPVVDPTSAALAERTLELFPESTDVRVLKSDLRWPVSVLDLMVQSMGLVASTGELHGVDPGQPGVPTFGRHLYHLPVRRLANMARPSPVLRKVGHARDDDTIEAMQSAYGEWITRITQRPVGGLVLDYDGTVCPTWNRFEPPPDEVQRELVRLVQDGLVLAFATGRGRSLHDMTRTWMPTALWSRVQVGLYNGAQLLTLADEPDQLEPCTAVLEAAAIRLEELGLGLNIERRKSQLSISRPGPSDPSQRLRDLVESVVARSPALACKVAASGHSVDVVPSDAGKVNVLRAAEQLTELGILAIGDQGQVGGNDFELLSAVEMSLSVDRCSPDPTRCWNLDLRGERGPELLVRYLRTLQRRKLGFRFGWPAR